MIGFIKKFINSDFTKPLNTLIDEVKATLALIKAKTDTITANLFTSTHATRIDATISSRALETTAQAIKAKTDLLSAGYIKPSSTVRLNVDAERSSTGSPLTYKFLMKLTGTINISLDVKTVSSGSTTFNISVRVSGIEIYTSTANAGNAAYVTKTLTSVPVYSGVVEVSIHAGVPFRSKSFKVMYDDDNLATPTLL